MDEEQRMNLEIAKENIREALIDAFKIRQIIDWLLKVISKLSR